MYTWSHMEQHTEPEYDPLPELPRLPPRRTPDTTCTARQIRVKFSGLGLVAHSQDNVGSSRPASGATSMYIGSYTVTTARPSMAYCRTSPPAARRGPDTTYTAGQIRVSRTARRIWITHANLRGDIHVRVTIGCQGMVKLQHTGNLQSGGPPDTTCTAGQI